LFEIAWFLSSYEEDEQVWERLVAIGLHQIDGGHFRATALLFAQPQRLLCRARIPSPKRRRELTKTKGTNLTYRTFSEIMTFNVARYRTYFEDARRRAEQMSDPVEKLAWLRMAERWFKLLTLAQEHAPNDAQGR
jgi:hypothetical protein